MGAVWSDERRFQRWLDVEIAAMEAWADAGVRWSEIDAVAVTYGPGLAGSLLVGINFAKALAWVHDLPLIAVNHLEGHVYAAWLHDANEPERPAGVDPRIADILFAPLDYAILART